MEIQLWYDMMRQGVALNARDSTICPTIGSVSTASDETTITLNVPDLRRTSDTTSTTQTTGLASQLTATTTLTTESSNNNTDVANLSQLSNDEQDEDDDANFPLITELGIGSIPATSNTAHSSNVNCGTRADILSESIDFMTSATSEFSVMSTPPSD